MFLEIKSFAIKNVIWTVRFVVRTQENIKVTILVQASSNIGQQNRRVLVALAGLFGFREQS